MKAQMFNALIEIDPRTIEVGNSFWIPKHHKARNPEISKWIRRRLKRVDNPVLIDVGAHTGLFTLMAALMPALRVYAFEPVFGEVLKANVKLNDLEDRVKVFEVALGSEPGEAIIHVPDNQLGSHATMSEKAPDMFDKLGKWHDATVPVDTLDNHEALKDVKPTVLKIDVEGMEKFVIEGGEEMIRKHKPDIIVEYIAEHTKRFGYGPSQITRLLHSWGYVSKVRGNDAACIHGAQKSDVWPLKKTG